MLLLVIFIGLGTAAIIYIAVGKPIQYLPFKSDSLTSLVPDWNATRYNKKGWNGWRFKSGTAVFRVLWEVPSEPEHSYKDLIATLNSYTYKFDVPIFDGGHYVLKRYHKGFKVVVVFKYKEKVYWVDLTTNSTLKKYKQVVDTFLLNLKVEGKPISSKAREAILTIDRQIPITFIQTGKQIMIVVIGIYAFLVLGMIIGFKYFGTCPAVLDAIVCSPMSTLQTKTTFKNQYTTCCVCLKADTISVYTRKKLVFEIPLSELQQNSDFLKKGRFSYDKYYVTINDFHRWKPYLPPPAG